MPSSLRLSNTPLCIYIPFGLLNSWWTLGLLPPGTYCERSCSEHNKQCWLNIESGHAYSVLRKRRTRTGPRCHGVHLACTVFITSTQRWSIRATNKACCLHWHWAGSRCLYLSHPPEVSEGEPWRRRNLNWVGCRVGSNWWWGQSCEGVPELAVGPSVCHPRLQSCFFYNLFIFNLIHVCTYFA